MARKKINMSAEQERLYNELKKLTKRANQRLVRLERYSGRTDSWAAKRLKEKLEIEKLQAWTGKNRIRLNKKMTITQLKAVTKATEQFLKSKTSTKRGIEKVKKSALRGIKLTVSNEDLISDEEAETLYNMLGNEYVKDLTQYIPASDFWILIEAAKEFKDSEENFLERIDMYIEYGNDETMRNKLKIIYNKYVKK